MIFLENSRGGSPFFSLRAALLNQIYVNKSAQDWHDDTKTILSSTFRVVHVAFLQAAGSCMCHLLLKKNKQLTRPSDLLCKII